MSGLGEKKNDNQKRLFQVSVHSLQGMLRNSIADDTFTVIGDVNRINQYGNQSLCVHSAMLRKYCYCV